MGDDVQHVPLRRKVGLSAAPADAAPEARAVVHDVTRAGGGRGESASSAISIREARGLRRSRRRPDPEGAHARAAAVTRTSRRPSR